MYNERRTVSLTILLLFAFMGLGCGTQQVIVVENDNIPMAYIDADGTHRSMERDSLRNPYPHMLMTDGRVTLNDRCPVRKSPLNLRLPILFVNGQPIGFCWTPCEKVFVQDPAKYLNEIGVPVNCCVDPSRPAVLDSNYVVYLGYESFYFADSANLQRFMSNIYKYCGQLTDPVSKERFIPDENSPTAEYNDQTYVFASASAQTMFESMPAMYYLPAPKMIPKDSTVEDSDI